MQYQVIPKTVLLSLCLSCTGDKPHSVTIDTVLYNGTILTGSESLDRLYIHDGIVIEPPNGTAVFTREIDLNGRVVLPSFHDAHTHLLAGSFVSDKLLLVGTSTMSSITAKLANYVETQPDLPWIVGYGWIKSTIDNPNGVSLDEVTLDEVNLDEVSWMK